MNSKNNKNNPPIVIHYYWEPLCGACNLFKPEWLKVRQHFHRQPQVIFHEINNSSSEGRLQTKKHSISRFPTVTWSEVGINQPQRLICEGAQNANHLIDRIQAIGSRP